MLEGLPGAIHPYRGRLPAWDAAGGHMALTCHTAALAQQNRLTLIDLAREVEVATLEFPDTIDDLSTSPSGRFLAAVPRRPHDQLWLHDRKSGRTTTIHSLGDWWLGGFGFVRADREEKLLVARDERSFTVFDLRDGPEELSRVHYGGGFQIDKFVGLPAGFIGLVRHGQGEAHDAVGVVPFRTAVEDPGTAASEVGEEWDYAYRLILGPAPASGFVAFRDPEEDEDPDPDNDDEEDEDDTGLRGFRGIYLRDLRTRALIERVPWNGPVAEGDQCFATNAWVTIAMRSQVSFIRRAATDTTVTIATRSAAVDLDRQRVALITPDVQLNTLEVDDGSR